MSTGQHSQETQQQRRRAEQEARHRRTNDKQPEPNPDGGRHRGGRHQQQSNQRQARPVVYRAATPAEARNIESAQINNERMQMLQNPTRDGLMSNGEPAFYVIPNAGDRRKQKLNEQMHDTDRDRLRSAQVYTSGTKLPKGSYTLVTPEQLRQMQSAHRGLETKAEALYDQHKGPGLEEYRKLRSQGKSQARAAKRLHNTAEQRANAATPFRQRANHIRSKGQPFSRAGSRLQIGKKGLVTSGVAVLALAIAGGPVGLLGVAAMGVLAVVGGKQALSTLARTVSLGFKVASWGPGRKARGFERESRSLEAKASRAERASQKSMDKAGASRDKAERAFEKQFGKLEKDYKESMSQGRGAYNDGRPGSFRERVKSVSRSASRSANRQLNRANDAVLNKNKALFDALLDNASASAGPFKFAANGKDARAKQVRRELAGAMASQKGDFFKQLAEHGSYTLKSGYKVTLDAGSADKGKGLAERLAGPQFGQQQGQGRHRRPEQAYSHSR